MDQDRKEQDVYPLRITINCEYDVLDRSRQLPFAVVFGICRPKPKGSASDGESMLLSTSGSIFDVPFALSNGLLRLYRCSSWEEVDLGSFSATASAESRYISLPPRRDGSYELKFTESYRCPMEAVDELAERLEDNVEYRICVASNKLEVPWWAYGQPEDLLTPDRKPRVPSEAAALVCLGKARGRASFEVVPSLEWPPQVDVYLQTQDQQARPESQDRPAPKLEVSVHNRSNRVVSIQSNGHQFFLAPGGPFGLYGEEYEIDRRPRISSIGQTDTTSNFELTNVDSGETFNRLKSPVSAGPWAPNKDLRPKRENMTTLRPDQTLRGEVDFSNLVKTLPDGMYCVGLVPLGAWWCWGSVDDIVGDQASVPRSLHDRRVPPIRLTSPNKPRVQVVGGISTTAWKGAHASSWNGSATRNVDASPTRIASPIAPSDPPSINPSATKQAPPAIPSFPSKSPSAAMSSLVDAVINSDAPPSTDAFTNLASQEREKIARRRLERERSSSQRPPSSSRPRGAPPSDSQGPQSDADGFMDDYDEEAAAVAAALRRRRGNGNGPRADVPRVVDQIGEAIARRFEEFLESFVEEEAPSSTNPSSTAPASATDKYYVAQIHGLKIYNLSTLYVDFTHLLHYEHGVMAGAIADHFYRYQPYLVRALHNLIAKYEPRYFREHRQPDSQGGGSSVAANAASQSGMSDPSMGEKTVNQQTDKMFTLAFYNLPLVSRIRQLRTDQIGRLTSISGTVTRTSEVRPELHLGTFICESCNNVVYNLEQTFRYTEPTQCPNATCGNRERWRLDIRQSTFVDWQKIRVQENSAEIPTGSMPRTMDVIVRGEIVDRAKAGEKCVFTGTLIVVPDVSQFKVPGQPVQATRDTSNLQKGGEAGGSGVTGLKALGVRDLTYRMAFMACMITPDLTAAGQTTSQHLTGQSSNILASLNQTSAMDPFESGEEAQQEYLASLSQAEINDLRDMVHKPNIYMRLVDSIAPTIYGHQVIKKGLLLQLMGGVSKVTPEGMALRGDINICVVGDPSTSKSQFLKYITSFLPRAVYTSGKASSAAGLTAAVVKDEETGDHTIEAGALMLADNGICAIDEFDKMDMADQVAIHEAMEQQTISIAKAGIHATLNARTSILAAANPVGGRYNRKTTLRANVNMSAPIMSRFDLFFVVLDDCNEAVDRHLANHIVGLHQRRDAAVNPEFSTEQLQRYVRFARTFKPEFTEGARAALVHRYKELRADDAQGGVGRNSYRITVRQLESMIRLSEAIAKANCVTEVTADFVGEAFKLLRQSIISVEKDDVEFDEEEEQEGATRDGDGSDVGDASARGSTTPARPQRTQVTYDKYMKIVNLMVRRVGEDERESGDGVEENDLVLWYVEQVEEELEGMEDMEREQGLARKVVKRMVKENILMLVRGEGLAGEDGEGLDEERRIYVLHPNFAVEEVG